MYFKRYLGNSKLWSWQLTISRWSTPASKYPWWDSVIFHVIQTFASAWDAPAAYYVQCFLIWGIRSEQRSSRSQWAGAHPASIILGSWTFESVGGLWGRKPRTRRGFRGITYLGNGHEWLWIFWDLFRSSINRCQYCFIQEENSLNMPEISAVSN